jgi:hypothetical protein
MKDKIKVRKGPVGIDNVLNLQTRIHGNGKQARKPKYSKRDRHNWKLAYA